MHNSPLSKLVLRNRAHLTKPTPRVALWIIGILTVGMLAVLAIMMIYLAHENSGAVNWDELRDKLIRKITTAPFDTTFVLLALLATVLQVIYVPLAQKRERLVLTDLGIEYVSPLPSMLQFLQRSWSLQWSQIRRADLKAGTVAYGPAFVTLTLDAGLTRRSLRPYMWVDPANYSRPPLGKLLNPGRPDPQTIITQVVESPLMRFMQNLPHIKLSLPNVTTVTPFSLEKNPWALLFVIAFFVLIGYGLVDGIIANTETYLGRPFYEYYVLGGGATTALGVWLMRRAKVPWGESIIVATLTGGAFGAALYPGLLRLNQLSDDQGLQAYRYTMRQPADFVPTAEGLPEVHFPDRHREFWSQYAAGRTELFELRKGGLGFYQINMQPLYERIRNYYEGKK